MNAAQQAGADAEPRPNGSRDARAGVVQCSNSRRSAKPGESVAECNEAGRARRGEAGRGGAAAPVCLARAGRRSRPGFHLIINSCLFSIILVDTWMNF